MLDDRGRSTRRVVFLLLDCDRPRDLEAEIRHESIERPPVRRRLLLCRDKSGIGIGKRSPARLYRTCGSRARSAKQKRNWQDRPREMPIEAHPAMIS
jgi:hypothetical protein